MPLPLIWWLGGSILTIFTSVIVYKLLIDYIDKKKLVEISKKYITEELLNKKFSKAIIENINKGNVQFVDIGLYSNDKKKCIIRVEGNNISDDISRNLILYTN